jgi:hypothetical protein
VKTLLCVAALALVLVFPSVAAAWSEYYFRTPSGNIQCSFIHTDNADEKIDCLVASTAKGKYGYPLEYEVDSWRTVQVWRTNQGVMGEPVHVLQYGQTLVRGFRGTFTCASQFSGLTCRNRFSHHGFFLSRDKRSTF